MTDTLLIELGTEELPPGALRSLADAFADGVAQGLAEQDLPIGKVTALASPRRLAVRIMDTATQAPDREETRFGPAVAAAFDKHGQPTKAAEGFARSCGVSVSELERRDTDKGQRLAYQGTVPGQPLTTLLPSVFADAIKRLPIPKRMRWGAHEEAFVRPVHWLTALHGDSVIPLTAFTCTADRVTHGHRFHHPEPIVLTHADDYADKLENPGHVIVDLDRRRELVKSGVAAEAQQANGAPLSDHDLIEEVTALVEWPVALTGRYDQQYLDLPREVIVSTLKGHQRYFPVVDQDGTLLPLFITVANIESRAPERVIAGNERVIRPRLADALFFWERDRQRGLDALESGLDRVTFQKDLGSIGDKSRRIAHIAAWLAQTTGTDKTNLARACALAKTDLLTEIVDEFPDLQGTMGCYYAREGGETETVAIALDEQYAPRQAGAPIASTDVGRIVALSDRLDTLAGIFAIGNRPTGEKDPYALRRAALGVLRILIEGEIDIDLQQALSHALIQQPVSVARETTLDELISFHLDRLRAYYTDQGVMTDIFDAVAANGLTRPLDFDRRVHAVWNFLQAPEAVQLCSAHKRIRNILKDGTPDGTISASLLLEPAEQALNTQLLTLQEQLDKHQREGDYKAALAGLARLQAPVDRFFNDVRVMSDDADQRQNRLVLLGELDRACRSVADISRLNPTESAQ